MKPSLYSTRCSPAPSLRSLARFVSVTINIKIEQTAQLGKILTRFNGAGPSNSAEPGLADGGADL